MAHYFIVVEPDPIVSMDLVGALRDGFPGSNVHAIVSMKDLVSLLGRSPVRVLINQSLLPAAEPGVLNGVIERGGQIISIGAPPAGTVATAMLEVPFTSEMIVDAVV